ncbi:tetratricopeptide repeat protein [Clostridium sp. MCC353]|uniref:tetratricopeptide repeat protein n=1 Tax=Clostridium sp. MCC353 TaxID=2592646 RepID=UPI001C019E26|nr:tetratricopeptide repeat protein [Clostridium sp. MCC353]MBT9778679.1 tetratricopeptide repeat protein [Clostridium sp. MCC353]
MEENEYYTIPESQLCRKCHVRRIDLTENSNSILCKECREEQIKYPFPKKMIPAAIIIILLLGAALIRVPKTLSCYKIYQSAKAEAQSGEVYEALTGMLKVLETYPDSVPAAELAIELAMDYGYYDFGGYLINEYMVGKEVNDSTYAKMNMYTDRLTRYYNTYDKMDEISQNLDVNQSEEEIMASLKRELLACVDDPEQYPALIYYYLGNMSTDPAEAEQYLEAGIKEDPNLTMLSSALGTLKRRAGDFEGARELYQNILDRDKSDPAALRAMGILCMLEGDMEQGLQYVQRSYEEDPEGMYVKETLLIALMENGRAEEAETMKKQFEEAGQVFDEEFDSYLDGSVSLHDYYVDEE